MDCRKTNNCCSLDMGRGCKFCNCQDEAEASICEGCFKLHATDWLADMPELNRNDIYEVRFKNTRRSYYKNVNNLPLKQGDIVAVEASPGHDIGIVSLTGDIVARQMKRVGFNPLNGEFKKIYRKAKPYDIEKWQEAIALEHETMIRSRQIAAEMGLNMKIGDVEYQGDKIKAIFYYIADERVDFRELIKVFADQFRIRVEMKQIGARQEAGRIGGIGSCGRELCCASWISNFVSVTTNAARTQEISLNPQKLAGQCSKLKCCLVYELDDYIDARKEFPHINQPLQALDGEYYLVKSDILARTMSFGTSPGAMAGMITLPVERVKQILDINRKGRKVDSIRDFSIQEPVTEDPGFVNVIGEESITRFDKAKPEKNRRNRNKKRNERSGDPRQAEGRKPDTGSREGGRQSEVARQGEGRNESRQGNNRRNEGRGGEKRSEGRNNQRSGSRGEGRNAERSGGQESRGGNAGQDNRGEENRQPRRRQGNRRPQGQRQNQQDKPKGGNDKE
ncbi:MAG: hypothetical protein LUE26_07950 [Alistipes sp.]|nr:hypothetical protein [Alistipes sp.]